jgi:hypothetical protein
MAARTSLPIELVAVGGARNIRNNGCQCKMAHPKLRLATSAVLLALLMGAEGCSAGSVSDRAFARLFPLEDTNRSLTLQLFETSTTPKGDTLFTLTLSNASKYFTTFPPGYGARGFVWTGDTGEWQEVMNEVEFQDVELALGGEGSAQASLGFVEFSAPRPSLGDAAVVRIVVEGTQHEQGASRRADVLAFVDVDLPH